MTMESRGFPKTDLENTQIRQMYEGLDSNEGLILKSAMASPRRSWEAREVQHLEYSKELLDYISNERLYEQYGDFLEDYGNKYASQITNDSGEKLKYYIQNNPLRNHSEIFNAYLLNVKDEDIARHLQSDLREGLEEIIIKDLESRGLNDEEIIRVINSKLINSNKKTVNFLKEWRSLGNRRLERYEREVKQRRMSGPVHPSIETETVRKIPESRDFSLGALEPSVEEGAYELYNYIENGNGVSFLKGQFGDIFLTRGLEKVYFQEHRFGIRDENPDSILYMSMKDLENLGSLKYIRNVGEDRQLNVGRLEKKSNGTKVWRISSIEKPKVIRTGGYSCEFDLNDQQRILDDLYRQDKGTYLGSSHSHPSAEDNGNPESGLSTFSTGDVETSRSLMKSYFEDPDTNYFRDRIEIIKCGNNVRPIQIKTIIENGRYKNIEMKPIPFMVVETSFGYSVYDVRNPEYIRRKDYLK